MLSKNMVVGLIVGLIVAIGVTKSQAQQTGDPNGRYPTTSPSTVSPYLMLLPQTVTSGGQTVSVPAAPGTYQSLVRPALDARQQAAHPSLQNQPYAPGEGGSTLNARNPQVSGVNPAVRSTGHVASYQNYSHYFPPVRK